MNKTRASSNDQLVYSVPASAVASTGAGGFGEAVRNAWKDNGALLKAEQGAGAAGWGRVASAGDLLLLPMLAVAAVFSAIVDRGLSARWSEYERDMSTGYDHS